jgi:hypothetical protein
MKKIVEKIKLLNVNQAIIVAALIISTTYVVSNNLYRLENIFCGQKCAEERFKKMKNCSKYTARYTYRNTTAKMKNDLYQQCLKTGN